MPRPKPQRHRDKKVFDLRKKGLTFREIAGATNQDVKTVYRRYKRHLEYVGKLSTD